MKDDDLPIIPNRVWDRLEKWKDKNLGLYFVLLGLTIVGSLTLFTFFLRWVFS